MNDLTILHLSDLHINEEGLRLSILMQNLLHDIEKEMEFSENIVVVVSGDIVHKSNYECKENVCKFFKELKNVLGDRVKHIYIVPGNHDKTRSKFDSMVEREYAMDNEEFYKNFWKYMRLDFEDHLELVRYIYKIFYGEKAEERIFKNTYGVHIDEINGKNICFLLFNTAWGSLGDNDERNLSLGKFQLEQIINEYNKKIEEKEIALTVAVAHHPISWLQGKEEDMIKADFLCNNSLNVNTYICGHVHNRDVINWHNNRHSMTTLVSGLGWPDGNQDHPYAHTYSSYVFNLDVNSIDVYVRSSDDNYTFAPDFRIYTEQRNKKYNKIVMPINICKTQAYFNLGTVRGRSPKACYITDDIIEDVKNCILLAGKIQSKMIRKLDVIKYDIFENVICTYDIDALDEKVSEIMDNLERMLFKGEVEEESRKYLLDKHEELLMDEFSAYLLYLCKTVYDSIHELNPEAVLRTHFRYWNQNGEAEKYFQAQVYGAGFDEYIMQPLDWGELLEEAFENNKPLIASVNSRYCKKSIEKNERKETNKWEDFMTVIPQFVDNKYTEREEITEKILFARPLITFGLTVYREEDKKLLYILDYLKLDEVIGTVIKEFLHYFPIDIYKYVINLAEIKKGVQANADNE